MRLLVLGASGRTGTEVVKQALAAGHEVTAFVRDPAKLSVADPHLSVKVGDAKSAADLRDAVQGQDAVVSTLGSNKAGDELITTSTKALIDAMRHSGVKRVAMLSTVAVAPNLRPTGPMRLLRFMMKGLLADKSSGEALLRRSDLDWTIVYATGLQDGPRTGNYRVVGPTETVAPSGKVARADVAEFLLKQVEESGSVRQSPVITPA